MDCTKLDNSMFYAFSCCQDMVCIEDNFKEKYMVVQSSQGQLVLNNNIYLIHLKHGSLILS